MTTRQKNISKCLIGFIDRAYFPDYAPSDEDFECFFRIETHGKRGISEDQLKSIAPLLEAKGDYELQIKMVYSEAAEWWSKGWGWDAPIHEAITSAKREPAMSVYLEALTKIQKAFRIDPIDAILAYTGFSADERNKYFEQKTA